MIHSNLNHTDGSTITHTAAAFNAFYPYTSHVRFDLTVAIGSHTTARSIAQRFWTVHGATHASGTQHTLAAHLAVKHEAFDPLLKRGQWPLKPIIAYELEHRMQRNQCRFKSLIKPF
jgi:hypothetical protein